MKTKFNWEDPFFLSEQLTDMIVAQRAYQANTRVITTTDRLLEELNGLVR